MSNDYSKGSKFSKAPLPTEVASGSKVPITLHEHSARKAGKHYDLRIGGEGDWAIRHFPVSIGEKRLAMRQPTHPLNYYDFEGPITEGYGKGYVKLKFKGQGIVHNWSSRKISFEFDNNLYTLIATQPPDRWIIMKRDPKLEKNAYLCCADDEPLRRALSFETFSKVLSESGIKPPKEVSKKSFMYPYEQSSIQLRAVNPLDHKDVELDSGPRTRAYRDMALGKTKS